MCQDYFAKIKNIEHFNDISFKSERTSNTNNSSLKIHSQQ